MVAFPDGSAACNRESAIDILRKYGLTEDDVAEFAALVLESELKTLYNQVEDARKGDNWELMADDYYNAIVSAVNLIDEQLEKPRLQNARYPNGSNPSIKHYCVHSMKRLASWF